MINLAGKQLLLTQQMSTEMLFIAKGIDPKENRESLKKTSAIFYRNLKDLMNGDKGLGLPGTRKSEILSQMKETSAICDDFMETVLAILNDKISRDVLSKIASQNLSLLKSSDKVVKMLEKASNKDGGKNISPNMALTINIAKQQLILSQKITKELLLVALHIDPDENIDNLKKSFSMFDRSLYTLLDGDEEMNITAIENSPIQIQLDKVLQLWEPYIYIFKKTMVLYDENNNFEVPISDLRYAAKLNLSILKEMNNVVVMYQDLLE